MQLQPLIGENFNFMAPPKVIKPRAKFRDENISKPQTTDPNEEDDNKNSFNLMWDKRVVRGNTYASMIAKKQLAESSQTKGKSGIVKHQKANIKAPRPLNENNWNSSNGRIDTPKAVAGRTHASMSTEPFIEILTDKPPENEKEALTDFYIDRPVNRLFLYKKDGVDSEAQIWEGELFDFDSEVEPILQVLLGKTLEQSRMEVLEEEEFKVMKKQKGQFEQMRNAEMAEMQRLEAKEGRMLEEIEKRKLQYSKQKEQMVYAHQKLTSRLCSKKLLKYIKPNSFNKLEDIGVFRKPLNFGLYNSYLPWIIENVSEILSQKDDQEEAFQEILIKIQDQVRETHEEALKKRIQFKIDKKEEIMRKQLEKIEIKKKRKEEKIRQIEIKRIQDIKDRIQDKIFSRNENRQQLNAQTVSDISNYERQSLFIGVFGGFAGELMRFVDSMFLLLEEKQLKKQINSESLEKILQILLDNFLLKGSFELEIDENCLKDLIAIDPNLTLETMNSMNKLKSREILEILKANILGFTLNWIKNFPGDKELKEKILDFILKYSIEIEKGKNIKYVKTSKRTEFSNKIALCRVSPKLDTLNLRQNLIEKYQKLDPNFDQNVYKMKGSWEAELEDKYTATIPFNEDVRVLILHQIAQITLRRNFINELKVQFPDMLEIENDLEEMLAKSDQEIIPEMLKGQNSDLLILDYEMY